jgi:16S rRNA (uracil1498-N3)-methyltransferase
MPAERYFYPDPLSQGLQVQLSETEQRHLVQVMRTRPGEQVELVNGQGQLALATLLRIDKKTAPLVIDQVTFEPPALYQVILAQAIPRSNRLDIILEKGTELGMTEILLYPGEQSEKSQLGPSLLTRLQSITISALKQCGRLYLPKITLVPPLSAWTLPALPLFYGDLSPSALPFHQAWSQEKFPHGLIFAIGPEKGFSPKEEDHLKSLHAHGVKLHHNILRTETAALVALSLVNHLLLK